MFRSTPLVWLSTHNNVRRYHEVRFSVKAQGRVDPLEDWMDGACHIPGTRLSGGGLGFTASESGASHRFLNTFDAKNPSIDPLNEKGPPLDNGAARFNEREPHSYTYGRCFRAAAEVLNSLAARRGSSGPKEHDDKIQTGIHLARRQTSYS